MSDFGLRSDGFDFDTGELNPDDYADPHTLFGHDEGHGVAAGLSPAAETTDAGDGAPPSTDELETVGYDSDGDGTTDVLLADENHDGVTDIAMWDTNADGLIDRVAYDQDHDGRIDLIYHDDDFDGETDRVETADGTQEIPGYTSN
ncbi:hypothetical protein Daura_45605 [Dactylosporangium aurantiacum]|uniref:Pullulanase n=1 Tax=Dactylosporangium aurantiacum TaxID=35754 RepID=A0A9Q9IC69_9ACTN|nr:hypothetical protein [Dactylosporangium aurantiacum]MDG6108085.1 hypothetical protein [Dactylosporangium aurantiacum]UWZ53714.1 hypothetical protein Daura_45605 [Dactylosporangium aurantiacum]